MNKEIPKLYKWIETTLKLLTHATLASHTWQHSLTCTCIQSAPGRSNTTHTQTHKHYSHCENSFHWPPPPSVPLLHLCYPHRCTLSLCVCVLCMVLTHYVQGVGVVDGSKLVLHQTGVISLVWRHHAFHDQGPVLATHLGRRGRGFLLRVDGNSDALADTHTPINAQIQRNAQGTLTDIKSWR